MLRELHQLENHCENQNGILFYAMHDLFETINGKFNDRKFFIRCSYIEIYTDLVYDLL
jgi:centromeric protein E